LENLLGALVFIEGFLVPKVKRGCCYDLGDFEKKEKEWR
jgi:hypothetical protein